MERAILNLKNLGVWASVALLLAACLILRKWRSTDTIKFHFQPSSELWNDLLKNTKLTTMTYAPNIFCYNGEVQAFLYLIVNAFRKEKYRREIFTFSDG